LGAIDAKMGRDGTIETLLDEDLIAIFEVNVLCCCMSVERSLVREPNKACQRVKAKGTTAAVYLDCIRLFDVAIDGGAAIFERAVLENAPGCWTATADCQHWLGHSSVREVTYAVAVTAVLAFGPTSSFPHSMAAYGFYEARGRDDG